MSLVFEFSNPKISVDLNRLENFKKIIANSSTQFFHTFERNELIEQSKNVFKKFSHKKHFVHVGIGGSSLGPEMLVSALAKSKTSFVFINNIDPDEIASQLEALDCFSLDDCLFYFVSKSGGTAETLAALAIVANYLQSKNIQLENLNKYFVFATDPKKSELLELARLHHITTLEVPSDVGGRFCALTPVGFLPALFAGIDVEQLVLGARETQSLLLSNNSSNPLLQSCEFLFELYKNHGVDQTVLMPYSSKLKSFSFWFTQLWAESLGKKKSRDGKIINAGLTPIVSYGATDQHSQMQLFMEGPNNKCLIMIEVEKHNHDFPLSSELNTNNLQKLSGFNLSQLLKAELQGSIRALKENSRPVIHLKITRNDEYHMGAMILFFESLTALMGDYLMIDPFDQPGVEAGKIYAFDFLNQLK